MNVFKLLFATHHPDLVVLLEPRINGKKADLFIKNLKFPRSDCIKVNGFSGGIWFLWNWNRDINVLVNDKQFAYTHIVVNGNLIMNFTAVYVSPIANCRKFFGASYFLYPYIQMISGYWRMILTPCLRQMKDEGDLHIEQGCLLTF